MKIKSFSMKKVFGIYLSEIVHSHFIIVDLI